MGTCCSAESKTSDDATKTTDGCASKITGCQAEMKSTRDQNVEVVREQRKRATMVVQQQVSIA